MDPPAASQIANLQEPPSCDEELIRSTRNESKNRHTEAQADGSATSETEDLDSTEDPYSEEDNPKPPGRPSQRLTPQDASSCVSPTHKPHFLPRRTHSSLSSPSQKIIGLVRSPTAPSAANRVLPVFKDQVLCAMESEQRQRISSDSITTRPNIFAYAEPMSVEFEHTSISELRKRRRAFCLVAAISVSLLAILFCGAAIGLICGGDCRGASHVDKTSPNTKFDTDSPTLAPSKSAVTFAPSMTLEDEDSGLDHIPEEQAFVVQYINEVTLSEEEIRYPAPENPLPEELSLEWLVKATFNVTFTPLELRQAFALASFWFQSVVKPTGLDWLEDSSDINGLCAWNRVECDRSGEITSLEISGGEAHGTIPVSFGLLTALTKLDVSSNALSGPIPDSFGLLTNLQTLFVNSNKLSGAALPTSMLSMTSLKTLVLDSNPLTGTLPNNIDRLANLEVLTMSQTSVRGEIPASISKLDTLKALGIYECELSGTIPTSLTTMTQLAALWLRDNQLSGELLPNVTALTNLLGLSLGGNKLTGTIPADIGALTKLTLLSLEKNSLMGTIPTSIGLLTGLTLLKLEGASLIGPIPDEVGNLSALTQLDFAVNKLSGTIPSSMGQLTRLRVLEFSDNLFEGPIPTTVDLLTSLTLLSYRGNQLNGTIPESIGQLSRLEALSLAENEFTGSLPSQMGLLTSLQWFSARANRLTGTIPSELALLKELAVAQVYNNDFNGTVPICGASNRITTLYADCHEVSCPCCTACCPAGGWDDIQGLESTSASTPCDS